MLFRGVPRVLFRIEITQAAVFIADWVRMPDGIKLAIGRTAGNDVSTIARIQNVLHSGILSILVTSALTIPQRNQEFVK